MIPIKTVKKVVIGGWMLGMLLWAGSTAFSGAARYDLNPPLPSVPATDDSRYVGSETCKACHEGQFNLFAKTSHGRLDTMANWKDKVKGCESCHGPGKDHVDGGGDVSKIFSFKNKNPKAASESCLKCHAGKEEHNNYRRGEHWRNDIGCTDCHSSHAPAYGRNLAASNTLVSASNAEKPGISTIKLLKSSEPQLCLSCHGETKHQFAAPFKHKVLEGIMKCSDCHNPHGGFEMKQTRLATGADAACIKCHTDKQGPFVYEHAPIKTEGCSSCHTPHGSANPRLLKTSSVRQLCLECHSQDRGVGALEPAGPRHNLNAQYANCTACHVKIHGSQASPVFMR